MEGSGYWEGVGCEPSTTQPLPGLGASTSAVRALLRHARTAGKLGGGGINLSDQMEVAVLAAGIRANVEDLLGLHRQLLACAGELRLLVGVALALPGYEDSVFLQQGGGELGEGREAADGAGRDDVVGLATLACGQLLGAGVEDLGVGDTRNGGGATHEVALATHRLDQVDLRFRQRDRQDEARKPSSRANISDPSSFTQLRELKSGETVGDVDPPSPIGLRHGAHRGSLPLQKLQDSRDRRRLPRAERKPGWGWSVLYFLGTP